MASYRLAVNRNIKKDGQTEADFINCIAWNKSAEFAKNFLHKGIKIAVEGRIQTGSYSKDDGTKVYTTDVVVERHEFCESRTNDFSSAPLPDASAIVNGASPFHELEDDGELPF